MIFLITGTQEPFDRMVEYVDEWSALTGFTDIIGQISDASYKPRNFKYFDFTPIEEFDKLFRNASLIVAHAGMGTIISALQYSKPIIVMPRLAKYHEHRNDHQLATADSFSKLGYVKAAYSKEELFHFLNNRQEIIPASPISHYASDQLTHTVQDFIK